MSGSSKFEVNLSYNGLIWSTTHSGTNSSIGFIHIIFFVLSNFSISKLSQLLVSSSLGSEHINDVVSVAACFSASGQSDEDLDNIIENELVLMVSIILSLNGAICSLTHSG